MNKTLDVGRALPDRIQPADMLQWWAMPTLQNLQE